MPSIITLTFNPCIDKSLDTETMVPEKKLRCSAPRLEPGGGGINVARVVHRLGVKALAIYPAGGYHGSLLTELLSAEGVDTRPIAMLADIRENINIREISTGRQFRFIEPGPTLSEHRWRHCLEAVDTVDKGGFVVVSGSLPTHWPPDLWADIGKEVKKRAAKLVVDASGDALRAAVNNGVYLIKPSGSELAALSVSMGMPAASPQEAAKALVNRGSVEIVVVSGGAAGALLVTKESVELIKAPQVTKQSSVGAGDSLLAGILVGLHRKLAIVEAVRYGVACGTAAVMNPGTELCRLKDVETLYAGMRAAAGLNNENKSKIIN